MISVITPTHRTDFLLDAWRSLKEQTYKDWEWVLVPNGGAVIPDEIAKNKKVRVVPMNIIVDNIGSLKNYANSQAKGDICVEFDHDDILMPTALAEVSKAFKKKNVVFAYSNCVEFRHGSWEPYTYSATYGWKYRPFEYQGHQLHEAIAFEASPHSLGYIYYAPNHLRAWRKDVYDRLGGHDITMKVIDDHDLMCRMYIEGEFYHIDKPLYLYRVHGENSWLQKNADVQWQTKVVYAKYIHKLVEVWCDRKGYMKYDLGAERGSVRPGWKGVDIRKGSHVAADLSKKYPFKSNSVGAFIANDFLEHIEDKVHTMNEIHRCLVPGGFLLSMTPSTDGRGAFQDPTHVAFWNENSFWYYTKKQLQHFVPEIKARFRSSRLVTDYPSKWHQENKIPYVYADLIALKKGYDRPDDHIPGIVEI